MDAVVNSPGNYTPSLHSSYLEAQEEEERIVPGSIRQSGLVHTLTPMLICVWNSCIGIPQNAYLNFIFVYLYV